MNIPTKICSICKIEKSLLEFHQNLTKSVGLRSQCKDCIAKLREQNKKVLNNKRTIFYLKYPWKKTYNGIQQRCNNPHNISYKYYGAKGIQCLITVDELKELWFRDSASQMLKPSIDRIDTNGNYELDNCRYLELNKNKKRPRRKSILMTD